ncbi:hypothetical protein RBG61_09760 [Paludicola sp. MB14-C6]|uniref:hypothetical protein n=1 Tax=Paludihabitans sp. MB14-C6 TaxID=3070656 RepID=UPI0027DC81DA|nr:hypothetical protein [Paludicola sp. MB14-C6]WMJ22272.1 hypothetical protein RBG61_09760 [Paludicola sp. MB14-C6]
MNKTIIAQFDSIDMATIAARNVMNRIKGIMDVKIAYKSSESFHEDEVFSDFFTPPTLVNGVLFDNSSILPINYNAIGEKEHESHAPRGIRVEIKTSNENVQNIKSNLRTYGGHSIKEFS